MRYPKGSIGVGEEQDYPLLRHVMDSQFITHAQLWQFLRYEAHETSRSSFCWRVKRLADGGFLNRHRFPMVDRDLIYSLAGSGVMYVQSHGAFYSGPAAGPTVTPEGAGVAHAIGLNSIRLELMRAGCVGLWQSEVEIRSHNELANRPYAKDYDAIVTLQLAGRSGVFALEFERTPKSRTDYVAIRQAIEGETQLDRFLYLVTNTHVQSFLKQCFWQTKRRVYIGLARDLSRRLPEQLDVIDAGTTRIYRLGEVF